MNYSLFQNIHKAKIQTKPFPHVVIENALNKELYNKISETFPGKDKFNVSFEENNKRDNIEIDDIKEKNLNQHIVDFINYHGSIEFWNEIIEYFGDHIVRYHPEIFNDINSLKNVSFSNNRFVKSDRFHINEINDLNKKVFLGSSASINTPVYKKSSVRGAHLDRLNKLYGGLFYLRQPLDNSEGGDLEILEWNKGTSNAAKKKFIENDDTVNQCSVIKKISYKPNSFIFFINGINSLHSVTEREITKFERRFFYVYATLNFKLTDIKQRKKGRNTLKSFIKKIIKV